MKQPGKYSPCCFGQGTAHITFKRQRLPNGYLDSMAVLRCPGTIRRSIFVTRRRVEELIDNPLKLRFTGNGPLFRRVLLGHGIWANEMIPMPGGVKWYDESAYVRGPGHIKEMAALQAGLEEEGRACKPGEVVD